MKLITIICLSLLHITLVGQKVEFELPVIQTQVSTLQFNDVYSFEKPDNDLASFLKVDFTKGDGIQKASGDILQFGKDYSNLAYRGATALTSRDNGLYLRAVAPGSWIRFLVGGGDLATDTKLVIEEDGRVGIGTVLPKSKLHVAGSIYVDGAGGQVIFRDGANSNNCYALTVMNGVLDLSSRSCPN